MSSQVIDITDGFKKAHLDSNTEENIAKHCEKYDISPLDAVKHFAVLARRQALKRFLAHIELFKMTLDVPGDVAELGVFRGLGLFTWANLLEAYAIGDRTKVVFGFDNWKGFSGFSPQDGKEDDNSGKVTGGFNPGKYFDELKSAIEIFDSDRFIPFKPRIKLVEGDIEQTVPNFVKENTGVRFSFVHFDCDLYKPTKLALEAIWDRVSRGGVVLFDEYAIHDWAGETAAVDEFFADKPAIQLKTLSWTNTPGAYIVKP
ncbi:MAG: TylF/MycF/NovP-related O-methyltransferase [Pseudomonadota bacterium]